MNHYNYQGSLTTPSKLLSILKVTVSMAAIVVSPRPLLPKLKCMSFSECNEVVNWVVAKKPVEVWSRDLAQLRKLINDKSMPITENWRPVQALNAREINSMGQA